MKDHLVVADQDAARRRLPHQHVQRGKLVIDPRAQKADGQHQRRGDPAERLFEIGAVLFGDVKQAIRREAGLVGIVDRVEIADHRLGQMPRRQRPRGA